MPVSYGLKCEVCNSAEEFTTTKLTKHLASEHGVAHQEYWWRYKLGLASPPLCLCGCGREAHFVSFTRGFTKFFNRTCALHYRNRETDIPARFVQGRRAWIADEERSKGFRQKCSVNLSKQWEDKEFADRVKAGVSKSISKTNQDLAEYRRNHGGRTRCENEIYTRLKEVGLNVRHLDARFNHGPHGGPIMDLSLPDYRLDIELDGTYHANMAEQDAARDSIIAGQGWKVVRFSNREVLENPEAVINSIINEIQRQTLNV